MVFRFPCHESDGVTDILRSKHFSIVIPDAFVLFVVLDPGMSLFEVCCSDKDAVSEICELMMGDFVDDGNWRFGPASSCKAAV